MLFVSAQPDEYYFLWQLILQLHNFNALGISKNDIHVLIGYHPAKGLDTEFSAFIKHNTQATFFTYPDTRSERSYPCSLKPHLLRKHYSAHPGLSDRTIFYHDSDMLFKDIPDTYCLEEDDVWYASDTRTYIGADYIINHGGNDLLANMCKTVQIHPDMVTLYDPDAGGAQYIIKRANTEYWYKVEQDSIALYNLIETHKNGLIEKHYLETGQIGGISAGINPWYAEMWSTLWNSWYFGYRFRVSDKLGFCWPMDPITVWGEKKILHYAGVKKNINTQFFCKGNYIHYAPFYEDLRHISKEHCSAVLVELISTYLAAENSSKFDCTDTAFILLAPDTENINTQEILAIQKKYLGKYLSTNITVAQTNKSERILEQKVGYYHCHLQSSRIKITVLLDANIIMPIRKLIQAIQIIRNRNISLIFANNCRYYQIDDLFKTMFDKILDIKLLDLNTGKFTPSGKPSMYPEVIVTNQSSLPDTIYAKGADMGNSLNFTCNLFLMP